MRQKATERRESGRGQSLTPYGAASSGGRDEQEVAGATGGRRPGSASIGRQEGGAADTLEGCAPHKDPVVPRPQGGQAAGCASRPAEYRICKRGSYSRRPD